MKEQLLNGFEQSPQDMINMAFAMPLDVKIEKSIALLKEYESKALEYDADGFYCCDSFGKDSGVIVHLCKLANVKHKCHHNLTTIDPPELIWFGKKHRQETVIHRPKQHLILGRMVEKGEPPTRIHRWCCLEYKERDRKECCKIIGVRIEESARRAGLWRTVNQNRNGGVIIAPIAYWTEKDVWDFHKLYNLESCSLYKEGFHRLGCVGCPMSNTNGQKEAFKRWPLYERLWRLGFKKMWDRWHGVKNRKGNARFFEKFGSADATFEWWLTGEAFNEQEKQQCIFEEMMMNT
jgi:phosphoadenosine phosphosulfate reductase